MIFAPALSAASITAARRVSTERISPAGAKASITGSTRASSSASPGALEPGRVETPPTSMICAPAWCIAMPASMAARLS